MTGTGLAPPETAVMVVAGPPSPDRPKHLRPEWRAAFWCAALACVLLALWLMGTILWPFAAGLTLGYLLDPAVRRVRRLGLGRLGAASVVMALVGVVLFVAAGLLVPVLGRQLSSLIGSLPALAAQLQTLATGTGGELLQRYAAPVLAYFGIDGALSASDLQSTFGDVAGRGAQLVAGFLRSLWSQGAALVDLASLVVITPVVAFYILVDWDEMVRAVDDLVPPRHRATVHELVRDIDHALAGFFRGQSLVCLFLGLWYGVGLSMAGLNFGFLIGSMAGVLSFIPYVGSLTALVLSAAVAIVQGWPHWTLLASVTALNVAGQFIEGNILSPKLVGSSVGVHPVWLMFALLAFGRLFGFAGLLVAVPVAAASGVLLRFAIARYRASDLYEARLPGP